MIRDPSDGSVREPKKPETGIPISENPLVTEIRAALLAGKVKPERLSEKWAYQRAWNDGIDFSLTQIERIAKQGT